MRRYVVTLKITAHAKLQSLVVEGISPQLAIFNAFKKSIGRKNVLIENIYSIASVRTLDATIDWLEEEYGIQCSIPVEIKGVVDEKSNVQSKS